MDIRVNFILHFIFWVIGLAVALPLGSWLTGKFLKWLRARISKEVTEPEEKKAFDEIKRNPLYIPNWLIGLCERPLFTIIVAFNISGTAIAMIAWITIKMIYNWGILVKKKETVIHRSFAFSALLGNLCSMFFALIGGLICRIPSALI